MSTIHYIHAIHAFYDFQLVFKQPKSLCNFAKKLDYCLKSGSLSLGDSPKPMAESLSRFVHGAQKACDVIVTFWMSSAGA
jgi:hypothetical protein